MTYVKTNVAKPGKNAGTGGNKKDKITIFDIDDVLSWPARDDKGVVITDNITFNEGAFAITVYATQHTIKAGHKEEGDPDKEGYIQTVEFEHPGDSQAILEFDTNWQSRNCGIIIEKCSTGAKKLYGTPCAPMHKVAEATDDKDSNHTKFVFTSTQKGPIEAIYSGTITLDDVKGTVAADATTVNVAAGEGEYQLTTGTSAGAALTALTNPVEGGVYTLLGSGGSHPSTIAASGNWLLKDGTSWTALAGERITLKAFKDGVSSYKFLEVSRA